MSGWSGADKYMEENVGGDFPAVNNITVYGYLPSDQVPSGCKTFPSYFPGSALTVLFSKIKELDRSKRKEFEIV